MLKVFKCLFDPSSTCADVAHQYKDYGGGSMKVGMLKSYGVLGAVEAIVITIVYTVGDAVMKKIAAQELAASNNAQLTDDLNQGTSDKFQEESSTAMEAETDVSEKEEKKNEAR